ncbi:Malonyl CoA-acyl carrier protein transacylase [Buchnera aphidicola (Takecallis arundicolens)]|uniref:ACP S-malonyltransferase n=1 Tax=Buchnera aphidicola TaxID=9 RepID=UPI003464968F
MIFKIAMIFPGQGKQNIHRILCLNNQDSIIKKTFEEASEHLHYNIWKAIQKKTYITKQDIHIQPIILTTSVAIYRFWKKIGGINPVISSGHSLGEYSALVCSDAITFLDGLKIVKKREIIMKKQMKGLETQMQAIIGLEKKIILKICKQNSCKKSVNIANINSKNQIVISGYKQSVQKTSIICQNMGAKTIILPINIAAHCNIMKKIKRKFTKQIKKINIQKTKYPVINSISVKQQISKHTIRKSLVKQLFQPVQWEKTMNVINSMSNIILEMGTNNILTNLHKKNYVNIIPMNTIQNINQTLNLLHKTNHAKK